MMTSFVGLMLAAWAVELIFGWPNWLYTKIRHPVVWIGSVVSLFETRLNQAEKSFKVRYFYGAVTTVAVVSGTGFIAFTVSIAAEQNYWGFVIEALIASSLLASRSLFTHVKDVADPLMAGDVESSRNAVSQIVGRDPQQLNEAGIARAAIESLAENASDGVIAPLFWGVLFGLPGLAAYKAINTLDSMIGHRSVRYEAFGGFAARLDDIANFIPARITGFSFALASLVSASLASAGLELKAFKVMFQDAHKHRSPNAGWPESAMAGALNIRLSGPRSYQASETQDSWLNAQAPDPVATDIHKGLQLYTRALVAIAALLAAIILCLGLWG